MVQLIECVLLNIPILFMTVHVHSKSKVEILNLEPNKALKLHELNIYKVNAINTLKSHIYQGSGT